MDIRDYRKIIIVGYSSSDKSWLTKHIVELTSYPLCYLDNEFWKPSLVESLKDKFTKKQKETMNTENWIIDGTYNSTLETHFAAQT